VQENGNNPENWYDLSCYYALLGLKKEMLIYLQKAIENNPEDISHAKEDPDFDSFRNDLDFLNLLTM